MTQAHWNPQTGPKPLGGVLFGLLLIGGGLLFLLQNLGVLYVGSFGDLWPVILIVIGAVKVLSPRCPGHIGGGLIIGGIGLVFLLRNFGVIYGNVWGYLWPVFLISIGLSMLVRRGY